MGEITKYLYDEDHLKIYDPRGVHRQHYSEVLRVLWVENFSKFFVDFFLFFFCSARPRILAPPNPKHNYTPRIDSARGPKAPGVDAAVVLFFQILTPFGAYNTNT